MYRFVKNSIHLLFPQIFNFSAGQAQYLLRFVSNIFDYSKLDDAIIAELYLDDHNKVLVWMK